VNLGEAIVLGYSYTASFESTNRLGWETENCSLSCAVKAGKKNKKVNPFSSRAQLTSAVELAITDLEGKAGFAANDDSRGLSSKLE